MQQSKAATIVKRRVFPAGPADGRFVIVRFFIVFVPKSRLPRVMTRSLERLDRQERRLTAQACLSMGILNSLPSEVEPNAKA